MMDILSIYIATFFIIFLIMPVTYFILRFLLWFVLEFCGCSGSYNNQSRERDRDDNHHGNHNATRRNTVHWGLFYDRQGNIFTISDETTGNTGANRYPDFFYLEPSSEDAARIRAQLEKDDKDLPSYDEVMRMTSMPTTPISPLAASAGNLTVLTSASSSSSLPPPPFPPLDMAAPPYSEIAPSVTTAAASSSLTPMPATPVTVASTSRGASVSIPIHNAGSNTSV